MEDFDTMAKDFDTDRRQNRAQTLADRLRPYVGPNKTGLEFGCGTGLVGLAMADCFASLLLVDSSAGMIAQVEQKLARLQNPNISALCCDLLTDPPEGLAVDVIFMSLVLHHIADTAAAFARFHSLLKPGGCLLVVDLDTDIDGGFHRKYPDFTGHNGFARDELICLAKQAGFAATTQDMYTDYKMTDGTERAYTLFLLVAKK